MSIDIQASVAADGSIVDWQYDFWTNSLAMRPRRRGEVNLLAAWHVAQPFRELNGQLRRLQATQNARRPRDARCLPGRIRRRPNRRLWQT
jgi:hypothetical protein